MDAKTKKIVVGCFVGGATCSIVAIVLMPAFWLLGLMAGAAAGFTAGYIGYDFMAILRAVPTAREKTREALIKMHKSFPTKRKAAFMFYSGTVQFMFTSMFLGFFFFGFGHARLARPETVDWEATGLVALFLLVVIPFISSIFFIFVSSNDFVDGSTEEQRNDFTTMKKLAFWLFFPLSLPYAGICVIKYAAIGLWRLPVALRWLSLRILPAFLVIKEDCQTIVRAVALFVWNLFLLIHRKERTICAIDGTLGGLISIFTLSPSVETLTQKSMLILFGAMLGVFIGVLNYELVTKRWLIPRGHIQRT